MTKMALAFGWISKLNIGTRLVLAFATVLTLTAVLGGGAIYSLANVNRTASELATDWLPGVRELALARIAVLDTREFEMKYSKAEDDSYRAEYEDKIKERSKAVEEHLTAYTTHASGEEETKLHADAAKKWKDYSVTKAKVMELGRAGKADDAKDISDGSAKMAADEAIAALDTLSTYNFEGAQRSAEEAASVYTLARNVTLALIAAALAVGALLSFLITRSLKAQLGGEPAEASRVARAVADGDLSTVIHLRTGDSTSLMASLQHMQHSLSRVVATVREGSERVALAGSEIAEGNLDLSGRTEQQASALQESSASMEELGAAVKQNAEHAAEADTLAKRASDVARRGGDAVARVVQTMGGINESSRRIADIIGTIDGIAFQTNILALNAAVEAARAGEQGRGFAVVAAEVRSLAQRSADAAREIKTLISASVERVEQGAAQVDEAGDTMKDVVASITRVTAIMAEISAASREQSLGVAQVGQAVSQMDTATQRNAALVEQSAAAAEALRAQAQELVQVVAGFQLSR